MARILVIEDDEQARALLKKLLRSLGHDVDDAADGATGIRIFQSNAAQLVVTDIVMPEEEGLKVIRELRRSAPGVKILAISGGGARLRKEDCLEMATHFGADSTLQKPFRSEQLTHAVEELLA